ncbi:Do family serine endopeptidase [Pseudolabrys taiwanensis]|uniref:Probable periplasmic serine endoprotease DegP-like n=1 Tax=Pseudolabrys taiwanensis TaxID=331696 RepID=A0A345ZV43_9HYPH|nr:Do family serine endopeptidase [Pseudolabrys taiwanensis]AXK80790.1 Do family serine endopeptidase [Pseudolabrys taiwanensis]
MQPSDTSAPQKRRAFSARKAILLATTIAGLGAAAFVATPNFDLSIGYPAAHAQNLTEQARKTQAPVGFADIVEKVKPAVMSVRVKIDGGDQTTGMNSNEIPPGVREFFRRFGMPDMPEGMPRGRGGRHQTITGQGSGFFISADGYAVTNNHVVDKAENVEVTTDDGKTHKAKVIGTDPRTDLALIKVEGGPFPYVKLADGTPRIGDWVLAVGNPFGLGGTVTAGIVSARGRDIGAGAYDDFIQIDAPVNKGNSGGPTFDTEGNVIGVNTAIFSPSGGSVGIAFAIPASTVKTVVEQLKDHGSVTRGWIGVQIQPVTQDIADSLGLKKPEGALVAEPQKDSPAQKAGIEAGDVITAVNGQPVKDARDLAKKIGSLSPKTNVQLSVLHKGSEKTVSLTLGELPNQREAKANTDDEGQAEMGKLGLTLAPASGVAGAGSQGVVVTGVDSSGVAADRGFSTGDVILEVAGKSVASPGDVRKVIADVRASGKRSVLMRVKSGDNTRFVALPVGQG